jgi:uncharacterized membrane protein
MSEESAVPPVEITEDDKLWALLSWLLSPVVPVIVLLLEDKKDRPFIKYNAIQALILVVIGWVVSGILSVVVIGCFTGLLLFIYQIYLAIQAYGGNWVSIPILTDFAKNQGWI